MLNQLFRHFKLSIKSSKGLDKPIFLIASITLAILFLMAYYTATTGWLENIGTQFNDRTSNLAPDPVE